MKSTHTGFAENKDELTLFIEKKKEELAGEGGDVFRHNPQSIGRIMEIRFGILDNILHRISETVGDGGIDVKTSGYEQFSPIGPYSPISHLCSTDFLNSEDEPCQLDLASQTGKSNSMGRRTEKINIIYEIVSALLSSELYQYDIEKKLFHTWNEETVAFEKRIYIRCEFARDLDVASAAAAACGENAEWRASVYLNPDIITRPQETNSGVIQSALKRDESMNWAESWMAGFDGLARWQPKEEKTVFGVPVGTLTWPQGLLTHPLFESPLFKDPKTGASVFTPDKRKIELENIYSIMLLLEHELWHVAFGMYDPFGNAGHHVLATPKDIGLDLEAFGTSSANYQGFRDMIPGVSDSEKTQLAYTDMNGHGGKFTSLAYLGSGFTGQLSPFDMFSLINQKKKKQRKNRRTRSQATGSVKKDGTHTSDSVISSRPQRCTNVDEEDEDLGGGGGKTRRKRRKTRRRKRRKMKTRKRKSKRKRRWKRRKTRRKTR